MFDLRCAYVLVDDRGLLNRRVFPSSEGCQPA